MVGARELREIRAAGGGIRLAQDFHRPRRRVRPDTMHHKTPPQSVQLELFLDDSVDERSCTESLKDPARPLADLFPDAYCVGF